MAHPFRRERGRGLAILGLIAAVGLVTGLLCHSLFWGLFAVVVLGLSLEAYYFPTRYSLSESGLLVQKRFSRSTASWERFRRVYEDRRGLTLSPYRRRAMLEPYRSVRLLFDGGDRESILRRVRASLAPEVEWLGAGEGSRPATKQGPRPVERSR